MVKKLEMAILAVAMALMLGRVCAAEPMVLFSFEEGDVQGWEVPDWAMEKEDHVAESIATSTKYAKEGDSSLEMMVDFPGAEWTGAYAEIVEYMDWGDYDTVSVDIYLPETAPQGLKAKLILTVGDKWEWVEMSRSTKLVPGEWTTISANLKPGTYSWRKSKITDEFRKDVRKFGVRIESNMKPAYQGPIYIDNIILSE